MDGNSRTKNNTRHSISRNCISAFLLFIIAACSNGEKNKNMASSKPMSEGKEIVVSAVDFVKNSGLKAMTPQVYIFDKSGELLSTEYGYVPGQPLNIEANKPGPAIAYAGKLEKYLRDKGVAFDRWKQCGADYCVVRLLPDQSLGHCEYCDMTQSSLDAFFSTRGARVIYHSILLGKD